jgi:hypothetical protein
MRRRGSRVRVAPCWPDAVLVWFDGRLVGYAIASSCQSQYCCDEIARGSGPYHICVDEARAWVEDSDLEDRKHYATLDEAAQSIIDWQRPGRKLIRGWTQVDPPPTS